MIFLCSSLMIGWRRQNTAPRQHQYPHRKDQDSIPIDGYKNGINPSLSLFASLTVLDKSLDIFLSVFVGPLPLFFLVSPQPLYFFI